MVGEFFPSNYMYPSLTFQVVKHKLVLDALSFRQLCILMMTWKGLECIISTNLL